MQYDAEDGAHDCSCEKRSGQHKQSCIKSSSQDGGVLDNFEPCSGKFLETRNGSQSYARSLHACLYTAEMASALECRAAAFKMVVIVSDMFMVSAW